MRIATWNLEGRWDDRHLGVLTALEADVLLLTEVAVKAVVPGMRLHRTQGSMAPGRAWAAIATARPMVPLPDPHGASALARVDGLVCCASVLPWRACGQTAPWLGSDTTARTVHAVDAVVAATPSVWGGDWNHAMSGAERVGSHAGRAAIERAVAGLGLVVATHDAPHRLPGVLSIDHVAVPSAWSVISVERRSALVDGVFVSDHDAYVIEVDDPA